MLLRSNMTMAKTAPPGGSYALPGARCPVAATISSCGGARFSPLQLDYGTLSACASPSLAQPVDVMANTRCIANKLEE